MRLGSKARYGVMALLDIATAPEHPVSISSISKRQHLPVSYLEQLFLKLRRAGLVVSNRGTSGGYSLAKDPSLITVFDIFSAVEPVFKAKRCTGSEKGCQPDGAKCNAHDLWDDIDQLFHMFCKGVTLDQLTQRCPHVP